jgi:hypothetical protein
MSDYIPTTKDVREVWIYAQDITHDEGEDFHGAEFDRWLAARDAEVREAQADHDAIRINDLDTRLVTAERELAEAQTTLTGHGGWDEWIAEHIRIEADRDRLAGAVQAAYNALHMETRARAFEILHDALSGVVAEEPEWEYGVRETGDSEPFTDHYESLEAMSEEFDGRVVWNVDEEIVRRRKAGPWVPVEN